MNSGNILVVFANSEAIGYLLIFSGSIIVVEIGWYKQHIRKNK